MRVLPTTWRQKPADIEITSLSPMYKSVQLPTSADKVTLLAFAAARRTVASTVLWRAPLSIDISCPPGPQQQTCRTLLQRSIDGTYRRDGWRRTYLYEGTRFSLKHSVGSVQRSIHEKIRFIFRLSVLTELPTCDRLTPGDR